MIGIFLYEIVGPMITHTIYSFENPPLKMAPGMQEKFQITN